MIDFTLLGTGATLPLPERALTAGLLRCQGQGILFDCGEGTQTALRRFHASPLKIALIALTHTHGDHFFGLPGLLQTMGCLGRTEPLRFCGPPGLDRALEAVLRLSGPLPYPLHLVTLPPEGLPLARLDRRWPEGAVLQAIPTRHRVPSLGYCFSLARPGRFDGERARALGVPVALWKQLQRGETVMAGGRTVTPEEVLGPPRRGLRLVFSGDTAPCPALEEAARGADLLVHEATYAGEEQAELAALYGHSTFAQAGELAARAGVRRLWLCHFSQTVEDPEACLPLARTRFPGALCARDGMSITLNFTDQ